MAPPPDPPPWDEFIPDLVPKRFQHLQDFQKKAVVYSFLTVSAAVAALATGMSFQVAAPLIGFPGVEAAKHIRHWIEWRREHPNRERIHPEQRRQLEQHTVQLMSDAVKGRAWVTWTVIASVAIPSALQLVVGLERSVALASVDPRPILEGAWWRLLGGTYLHGSIQHFMGNMGALLVYGAILESKTSRLRLPLVYLLTCLVGSAASVLAPPDHIPSIGASGGVVGVIAYLFLFSRRQAVKFPAAFRGATATVFFGLIAAGAFGFWHIDNAGHAGGALMGFVLAGLMVDTARNFIGEPELPILDLLGWVALLAIVAGAVQTSMVLWQG
jgi:membrane associated rhomboid family serine protease